MSDHNDKTNDEGDKTAEELQLEASKLVEKLKTQLAPMREAQERMTQITRHIEDATKPLGKTLEQFQKSVARVQIDPKIMKGLNNLGSALRSITEQAERDYAPQLRSFAGLVDGTGDRIAELEDRISQLEEEIARLQDEPEG